MPRRLPHHDCAALVCHRLMQAIASGLAAGLGIGGIAPSLAIAQTLPELPSAAPIAADVGSTAEQTILAFQTSSFSVRIYRQDGQLYLNLWNKRTENLDLARVAVDRLPLAEVNQGWRGYVGGDPVQGYVRMNEDGRTEVELVDARGHLVVRESGYGASGSDVDSLAGQPNALNGNDFAIGSQAVVTETTVNLRRTPADQAEVVDTLPQGAQVDVIDRFINVGDGYIWYQVLTTEQTAGWLRGDLLNAN